MSTFFIIHGSYGYPEENWFPWLKNELEKRGHRVFVPKFPVPAADPTPGGHSLEAWMKTFEEYEEYIGDDTIFVPHSRGCVFVYQLLAKLKTPVRGVFFVAPWIEYLWYPQRAQVDSFHNPPFDWQKMKKASRYFEVFQSTNDEIPVETGARVAKKLDGVFTLVKNAGHFNTSSGYRTFPLLLEHILAFVEQHEHKSKS